MGIFGALTTAVTGLQAQSFALENISGNIANSQTFGYKRTDTSFADLVMGGSFNPRLQTSGSVAAFSRPTNDLQGSLVNSSSGTSLAIKGSGFLMVQAPTGESGGLPQFGGGDLYTRRGDFELDRNGHLVNGAGYFLMGQRLDPLTGNPLGSTNEVIQLGKDFYPATPTSSINYGANLPVKPKTANFDGKDPTSWLLDASVGNTVTAADSKAFLDSTISGDAITVYDKKGGAHDLQMRWGKVSNGDPAATPPTEDTWALFYKSDSDATGADVEWTRVDQEYRFNDEGEMTSPADGSVAIANLTIDGANLGDIDLEHGKKLTQLADSSGAISIKELAQDGAPSGEMINIEIADGGLVTATYSNGRSRPLFKIPVVDFNAPNRLLHVDGGAYAATVSAGAPFTSTDGQVVGAALEQSNVDIADEFTKMIVTQQAYSANTRVVSTADTMMQDTLNMIR